MAAGQDGNDGRRRTPEREERVKRERQRRGLRETETEEPK